MPRVATTVVVPAAEAGRWLAARDDVVAERADGDGRFTQVEGPFERYERHVRTVPADDDHVEVHQDVSFRLAVPFWASLFTVPLRRTLSRPAPPGRRSAWWAPPARLDQRAARSLGLLACISLVGGYLGTIITQTVAFAAEEFGSTTTEQAGALATTRIGVLVAVVLAAAADRSGRRRGLAVAGLAGCTLAVTGALAPSLGWLTASQSVARGFATALLLLIAIISAEEMPAGSRAYAVSLLAMCQALGAGMCLWVLPVADLGEGGWRLVYVVPLLGVPVVLAVIKRLPESKRFVRPHATVPLGLAGRARSGAERLRRIGSGAGPGPPGVLADHRSRLVMIASVAFLLALFATPASQLQNEFLRSDRDFSAARITLFTLLTATPGGVGVVIGGRLADVRGRRWVGAVGAVGGTVFTVLSFRSEGWPMWAWALTGAVMAGATVPALGVYRPELFPTSLRGKVGGIIEAVSLSGSAVGLLAVGSLADRGGGGFGDAFTLAAIGPLVAAVLVVTRFPETAQRELEDLNPEDRDPPAPMPGGAPPEDRAPPTRTRSGPPSGDRTPPASAPGGAPPPG